MLRSFFDYIKKDNAIFYEYLDFYVIILSFLDYLTRKWNFIIINCDNVPVIISNDDQNFKTTLNALPIEKYNFVIVITLICKLIMY